MMWRFLIKPIEAPCEWHVRPCQPKAGLGLLNTKSYITIPVSLLPMIIIRPGFHSTLGSIKTFQHGAQIDHLVRIFKSTVSKSRFKNPQTKRNFLVLHHHHHHQHFLGQCTLKSDPNKGRSNLFQITFRAGNFKDTNITFF